MKLISSYFKSKRMLVKLLIGVALLIAFCTWQNNSIVVTRSAYGNPKIPKAFDGFVIAHISDLHNKAFGPEQKVLLGKLRAESPDIIVVTGDLVDSRRYDLDTAMEFIYGAMEIAQVYYVPGNHEARTRQYASIKSRLSAAGVEVLNNNQAELFAGEEFIRLAGLNDPDFLRSSYSEEADLSPVEDLLHQWSSDETFHLLLSHRPELLDLYARYNTDLVFSGHAHGGQIRLPFIGGLIAPHQGFFPKYTSGRYDQGQTSMFVSRGLGNSVFPFRIFNRPEIIVVTLKTH